MLERNLLAKIAVFNQIRHANTGNIATHCLKFPKASHFVRLPNVFNKVRYQTF